MIIMQSLGTDNYVRSKKIVWSANISNNYKAQSMELISINVVVSKGVSTLEDNTKNEMNN